MEATPPLASSKVKWQKDERRRKEEEDGEPHIGDLLSARTSIPRGRRREKGVGMMESFPAAAVSRHIGTSNGRWRE